MRTFCFLLLFCVVSFSTSCHTSRGKLLLDQLSIAPEEEVERVREENEKRELNNTIIKRFETIRQKIEQGKIDDAEKDLILLQSLSGYERELQTLGLLISNARTALAEKSQADLSRQKMLDETENRLFLPDSYEKVLVIDANLPPLEMPKGAMEALVNRKISVSMDKAGVKELVQVLSREGLNVVADDALESGKQLSISVKDVPLKELFAYIARNMGIAFHLGENLIWITQGEQTGGAQLETRIIRLRQGLIPKVPAGSIAPGSELGELATPVDEEDNDLEEALNTFFASSPEGAAFRIFRNRNILMIRDTRENLRLVEEMVRELDKPPYQVVIEAKFITVSQDDLRDLGVEWTKYSGGKAADTSTVDPLGTHGKGAVQVSDFLSELGASAAAAEIGTGSLTLSGVVGDRTFDVLISAIEKKNSAITLSAPRVTVMNNRTARIRKGDKYYYFEEYDISSVDQGDMGESNVLVPTGTPAELPVGITFDVKVNIGNDGKTVLLGLKPAIVEFRGWENYLTGGTGDGDNDSSSTSGILTPVKLPRTHEQTVMTTVEVSSGQTVIMGGMITNSKSENVKKIPLLGDLPLVGFFFRRTENTSIPTNLLIFVTATVVSNRGEYLDVRATEVP
jgi:type IV pilus assembly protein PilQ